MAEENTTEEQAAVDPGGEGEGEAAAEPLSAVNAALEDSGGELVTPEEDKRLHWIARGLDRELEHAVLRKAGDEAGADAGQWFYQLDFTECTLAIRADCMKAYLASVSKLASMSRVSDIVGQSNFRQLKEPSSKEIRKSLMSSPVRWLPLCDGESPQAAGATTLCIRGDTESVIARETLESLSSDLKQLFDADFASEESAQDYRAIVASADDVIARVNPDQEEREGEDVFGRPITPDHRTAQPEVGLHVERDGDEYRAKRYGYVALLKNKLSVVSPLFTDCYVTSVHWCVLDHRSAEVSAAHIDEWLTDLGVVEGVERTAIEHMAQQITAGEHRLGLHLIASGTPPVNGKDAEVQILLDLRSRSGEQQDDGSTDFKRVNFKPNVGERQEIARLTPATKGTDGRDVMGNAVSCVDGKHHALKVGVGVQSTKDEYRVEHYYGAIEGALKYTRKEIAVVDTLVIEGDVGFETGNLEFKGEVIVKGSIGQGFSVKATGDVVVFDKVDAGATIALGGNVRVGRGVMGRKTKIMALGDVHAQFIHDAQVRSSGDILVGDFIHHATLRADGTVAVAKSTGQRGGILCGGQVWSRKGIAFHVAGSSNAMTTELAAGVDPEQAKELDLLSRKIDESNKHISRQLSRFHLKTVDVAAITKLLSASTGPQKKVLARAAKQLGQMVQLHQKLAVSKKEIEDAMARGLDMAYIAAEELVYPGVQVRIGDHTRKITDEMKKPFFSLFQNQLMDH